MRRQVPIAHLLHNHLYPNASLSTPTTATSDPPTFSAHLARNLVPEVRIEVATFYGDLNSVEARYPGLDYCLPAHRMRLGRFPHHARLFRAFDALGLTEAEIQDFCCWEGTKWARERYERDEGCIVKDTTGDEIGPFVDRREVERRRQEERLEASRRDMGDRLREVKPEGSDDAISHYRRVSGRQSVPSLQRTISHHAISTTSTSTSPSSDEFSARQHSHNISDISARRSHQITRNILSAWEQGLTLPPEIEQFLKEQSERGTLSSLLTSNNNSSASSNSNGHSNGSSRSASAAAAAAAAGEEVDLWRAISGGAAAAARNTEFPWAGLAATAAAAGGATSGTRRTGAAQTGASTRAAA